MDHLDVHTNYLMPSLTVATMQLQTESAQIRNRKLFYAANIFSIFLIQELNKVDYNCIGEGGSGEGGITEGKKKRMYDLPER